MRRPVSLRLAAPLLLAACLLLPACSGSATDDESPALPDASSIEADLAEYADTVTAFGEVTAIVAATHDTIIFEQYYGDSDAETYQNVQSVTKSVLSTLVGIALDEGCLDDLDATLEQLLPESADAMSPEVAGTTLRQLLTMTGGFPNGITRVRTNLAGALPDFMAGASWERAILRSAEAPPGGGFGYSNGGAHLVSAILTQACGSSALDFARSRLFEPLDIPTTPALTDVPTWRNQTAFEQAGFAWPTDPDGVSTGWWGLRLRPRDLVKLGQLYLDGGRWGDQQIVSESWIEEATQSQVDVEAFSGVDGYGFLWWTGTVDGDDAFWALGYGGQLIEVVPARDLTVAVTAELRLDDASSEGIDFQVLMSIVDDAVVSHFARVSQ